MSPWSQTSPRRIRGRRSRSPEQTATEPTACKARQRTPLYRIASRFRRPVGWRRNASFSRVVLCHRQTHRLPLSRETLDDPPVPNLRVSAHAVDEINRRVSLIHADLGNGLQRCARSWKTPRTEAFGEVVDELATVTRRRRR